jgi:bile acid:Na+ symporter, BASS family
MNVVATAALASVFAAMFALGVGLQPQRRSQEMPKFSLIARCLAIALVAVPAIAIGAATLLGLERGSLAGLLLIGISPGAPLALRRSHDSGGRASFSMVLQVMVAVLAVFAVPAWVLILDSLYDVHAGIGMADLARQVFLAQLLPLSLGAACAISFPSLAATLTTPLLRLSGLMLLGIVVLVLWKVGPKLPSLGVAPFMASALLASSAIGLGHLVGGPAPDTRTTSAIICSLRNPGIALLVASTNLLPETTSMVVLVHVLVTTVFIVAYLAFRRARAT